jgi:TctA family transporter
LGKEGEDKGEIWESQLGPDLVRVMISLLAGPTSLLGVAQKSGRPLRLTLNSLQLVAGIVLLKLVMAAMEALRELMELVNNGECRQVILRAELVTDNRVKTIRPIMHNTIKTNTLSNRSPLLLINSRILV